MKQGARPRDGWMDRRARFGGQPLIGLDFCRIELNQIYIHLDAHTLFLCRYHRYRFKSVKKLKWWGGSL